MLLLLLLLQAPVCAMPRMHAVRLLYNSRGSQLVAAAMQAVPVCHIAPAVSSCNKSGCPLPMPPALLAHAAATAACACPGSPASPDGGHSTRQAGASIARGTALVSGTHCCWHRCCCIKRHDTMLPLQRACALAHLQPARHVIVDAERVAARHALGCAARCAAACVCVSAGLPAAASAQWQCGPCSHLCASTWPPSWWTAP